MRSLAWYPREVSYWHRLTLIYALCGQRSYLEFIPSWEVASCATTQDFQNILWNRKAHYSVHKIPYWSLFCASSLKPIPLHSTFPRILIVSYQLPGFPCDLRSGVSHQYCTCMSLHPHVCYAPGPSHCNYTWQIWISPLCIFLQPPKNSQFTFLL